MITNIVSVDSSTQAELVRAAALILGNPRRGESIVDDVTARAVAESAEHDWTGPVTLDAWLFTLTVRACRAWLDGLLPSDAWAREREAERLQHDERLHVDVARLRSNVSDSDRLTDALLRLPAADRIAVVLHDSLGLPEAECTQITRESTQIVAARRSRGLMALALDLVRQASSPGSSHSLEEEQIGDHDDTCAGQCVASAKTIVSYALARARR